MLNHSAAHWRKNRSENIQAARDCRDTLIEHWGYSADDQRVTDAVNFWLRRARRCHAIVMGRAPIIQNLFVFDGRIGKAAVVDVYAQQ